MENKTCNTQKKENNGRLILNKLKENASSNSQSTIEYGISNSDNELDFFILNLERSIELKKSKEGNEIDFFPLINPFKIKNNKEENYVERIEANKLRLTPPKKIRFHSFCCTTKN